ncbi:MULTISPECIES: PD-(D/E)XK nuclease family protein [Acinetobacter]|uniref:PDDEXK-like family protein n=1 Tax=Acinetobacter TaxID=469 RepID=UPI0020779268|nr:PD-(D/E)XK nuclease family protein [Acinetobacter haemolyticus]
MENQLKALILDDDFTNLQNLANEEVNLMSILRVSHRELQHSNFLSWLFDPNATHGLGDYVFKEFIKIYFQENEFQNLGVENGLSVFDFFSLDFDDLIIKREFKNIDLLFISPKNKFFMLVENKIYSGESSGQLEKYRNIVNNLYGEYNHQIYIYLSLKDQVVSQEAEKYYVKLTYSHIIKLLEKIILNQRLGLADKVKFVLEQYLGTLKSMLNENKEIEDISKRLYKKYKAAFDLVYKYNRPTEITEIGEIISDMIKNESSIVYFHSNKTYIRFQPKFIHENYDRLRSKGLLDFSENLQDSWLYLFEFNVRNDFVKFDLKIGKGNQEIREKLHKIYSKNKNFFSKVGRKKMSPEWHLSFQKTILTSEEIFNYVENNDIEEIKKIITSRFHDLINNDLKQYIKILDEEMA